MWPTCRLYTLVGHFPAAPLQPPHLNTKTNLPTSQISLLHYPTTTNPAPLHWPKATLPHFCRNLKTPYLTSPLAFIHKRRNLTRLLRGALFLTFFENTKKAFSNFFWEHKKSQRYTEERNQLRIKKKAKRKRKWKRGGETRVIKKIESEDSTYNRQSRPRKQQWPS